MKRLLTAALCLIITNSFAFDHKHKTWNNILIKHTKLDKGQTLVDYRSLKVDPTELNEYLASLENLKKSDFDKFEEKQRLAFWINAYNAYTIKWILKHYPIKSIKETGSLFTNAWKKEFIPLFGKKISLDDIEHETIRKNFKEARIHFAVNCSSLGCPSIMRFAFTHERLEEQLEEATLKFLTNPTKNYVKNNTLYLSKIFDWYSEDFVKYHGDVLTFVKKYIPAVKQKSDIMYLDYNWKLNDY